VVGVARVADGMRRPVDDHLDLCGSKRSVAGHRAASV